MEAEYLRRAYTAIARSATWVEPTTGVPNLPVQCLMLGKAASEDHGMVL
jgi:hypothetical protein